MSYQFLVKYFIVAFILADISVSDIKNRRIPNEDIVFLILIWIFSSLTDKSGTADTVLRLPASLGICLLCSCAAGSFRLIANKNGFGTGDIKLIFALTLFTGFTNSLYMLILAGVLSIIYVATVKKCKFNEAFAFGAALSAAAVFIISLNSSCL